MFHWWEWCSLPAKPSMNILFCSLILSWNLKTVRGSFDYSSRLFLVTCNIISPAISRNFVQLPKKIKSLAGCEGINWSMNWELFLIRLWWGWMLGKRERMLFLFWINLPCLKICSSFLRRMQSIWKEIFELLTWEVLSCAARDKDFVMKTTWTELKRLFWFFWFLRALADYFIVPRKHCLLHSIY